MNPYISLIVPVYKVRNYIAETIQSIINQEYRDFELVLVDDGSPDDSAVIAESLLQNSDLAYSIIHTENRGVSAARNTGLENSKGQFVIMVDADDSVTSKFLSNYVTLIEKYPGCDIYSTSFTILKGEQVIEQPKTNTPIVEFAAEDAQIAFYHRSPRFLLPTLMYSKSFLDKYDIRFDESVRFSEDVQFIWRTLALNTKRVVHSSESGYHYILHEGSTMTASGVQKILTGCEGIKRLDEEIHTFLSLSIRNTFVPMWYFAMLHGAAKMLSFSLFKDLYEQSESKQYINVLRKSSTKKVKWVAISLFSFSYLGYQIMRKH